MEIVSMCPWLCEIGSFPWRRSSWEFLSSFVFWMANTCFWQPKTNAQQYVQDDTGYIFLRTFLGVQVVDIFWVARIETWPTFPQISYPSKVHPAQSPQRGGRFLVLQKKDVFYLWTGIQMLPPIMAVMLQDLLPLTLGCTSNSAWSKLALKLT